MGRCPAGSCIYVGDVGDNAAKRKRITVYRIAEPTDAAGSATVTDVFHATYPDGAHDAEALLLAPDGRLHVVTEGGIPASSRCTVLRRAALSRRVLCVGEGQARRRRQ